MLSHLAYTYTLIFKKCEYFYPNIMYNKYDVRKLKLFFFSFLISINIIVNQMRMSQRTSWLNAIINHIPPFSCVFVFVLKFLCFCFELFFFNGGIKTRHNNVENINKQIIYFFPNALGSNPPELNPLSELGSKDGVENPLGSKVPMSIAGVLNPSPVHKKKIITLLMTYINQC